MKTAKKAAMPANSHAMLGTFPDWEKVAGRQLARCVTPVAIYGSSLVLRAHTWEWMREVDRMRGLIVAAANKAESDPARHITDIVVLSPGSVLANPTGRWPRGSAS